MSMGLDISTSGADWIHLNPLKVIRFKAYAHAQQATRSHPAPAPEVPDHAHSVVEGAMNTANVAGIWPSGHGPPSRAVSQRIPLVRAARRTRAWSRHLKRSARRASRIDHLGRTKLPTHGLSDVQRLPQPT